jgi:hypothetical protein
MSNFGPGSAAMTKGFFFFGCTQSFYVNTGILPYEKYMFISSSCKRVLILLYVTYATDKIAVIRSDQSLIPHSRCYHPEEPTGNMYVYTRIFKHLKYKIVRLILNAIYIFPPIFISVRRTNQRKIFVFKTT